MPSLTSKCALRLLQQVAAAGGRDPAVGARPSTRSAVAARLVEPHDQVAGAVVGHLDGIDLDAARR